MSRVSEFLTENPVQYLASVSLDGKAKCRPFMFSFEKDGKLWFNTGNFKDVYKELGQPVCPDQRFFPYISVDPSEWKSCFC